MLTYKQIEELDADALFEIERKGVGPGWQDIIETCHKALRESCPDYKPTQIKEKFGGLRFYATGVPYTDAAYQAIADAERASEVTCEECGLPGKVQSVRGWWRCLCEGDYAQALERRDRWTRLANAASDIRNDVPPADEDNTDAVDFLEAGYIDKHGTITDKGHQWVEGKD